MGDDVYKIIAVSNKQLTAYCLLLIAFNKNDKTIFNP